MKTTSPPNRPPTGEVQQVAVEKIDRLEDARMIDEENVSRLQTSFREIGQLQPIRIVEHKDRYLCVIGNHRLEAKKRNGDQQIQAAIWPEGTPPKTLLMASLHENECRANERMEDTLKRVSNFASYHQCNFAEAAKLARVSESKLSKINKCLKSLCPAALQFISEKKIGVAVAYEVAKGAGSDAQQLEWLKEHAAGRMSRDAIIQLAKKVTKGNAKSKLLMDVSIEGVSIQLGYSAETPYETLFQVLSTLKSRLAKQSKLNHPVDLLPRLIHSGR